MNEPIKMWCDACDGKGYKYITKECPTCHHDTFSTTTECWKCDGKGYIMKAEKVKP